MDEVGHTHLHRLSSVTVGHEIASTSTGNSTVIGPISTPHHGVVKTSTVAATAMTADVGCVNDSVHILDRSSCQQCRTMLYCLSEVSHI